jgi:hypothetical protein
LHVEFKRCREDAELQKVSKIKERGDSRHRPLLYLLHLDLPSPFRLRSSLSFLFKDFKLRNFKMSKNRGKETSSAGHNGQSASGPPVHLNDVFLLHLILIGHLASIYPSTPINQPRTNRKEPPSRNNRSKHTSEIHIYSKKRYKRLGARKCKRKRIMS